MTISAIIQDELFDKAINLAVKMIKDGADDTKIMDYTELSLKEIKKLRAEHESK